MLEKSRLSNSIRNTFYSIFKYIVGIILPFIVRTILIKKIGIEYAGVTSLFTSILQVLSLSELGFSNAIVYALYRPIAEGNKQKVCALLKMFRHIYALCGIVIFGLGILVCPFVKLLITGSYPNDVNLYAIFVILLINTSVSYWLFGYKSSLLIANQRDDVVSKANILSNVILYSTQIVVLLLSNNFYVYVICLILGTLINNILLQLFSRKMYPDIICTGKINEKEKRSVYRNVGALFGHQLDNVIINSADSIVISSLIGLSVLTIYSNYYYIISSLLTLLISISNSFVASIGNSIVEETKQKNHNSFISFTYFIGFLNSFCVVMLLVLYQDFMEVWMGKEMLFHIHTMALLVISFYLRQFRRTVLTYKNAAGIWKQDQWKPYIAGLFNLVINIFLVSYIGIDGVIISTIISMVLIEIPWETIVIYKYYFECSPQKYISVQGLYILKTIILSLIFYWISSKVKIHSVFGFVFKGVILSLLCLIALVLFSLVDSEFHNMILTVKRLLCRKISSKSKSK